MSLLVPFYYRAAISDTDAPKLPVHSLVRAFGLSQFPGSGDRTAVNVYARACMKM